MNTPVVFRKTLLALAITGASFSTLAQTLGEEGLVLRGADSWTEVTGQYNGAFKIDHDNEHYAVVEATGDFKGDLTFNTSISATGEGTAGIELSEAQVVGDLLLKGQTRVQGGETNLNEERWGPHGVVLLDTEVVYGGLGILGEIDVEMTDEGTAGAVGLLVEDSYLEEGLSNEGTIRVKGAGSVGLLIVESELSYDPYGDRGLYNDGVIRVDGDDAIGVHIESSQIPKFENNGRIEASGDRARGVLIQDSRWLDEFDQPNYEQGLSIREVVNQEVIQVAGTDAVGFEVFDARVGGLANEGDILVSGEGAIGVRYGNYAHVAGLGNHGRLIVEGDGSQGVVFDGARFFSGEESDGRQLRNDGLIEAGDTAIRIGEFTLTPGLGHWSPADPVLVIDNEGSLTAGRAAIDASSSSTDRAHVQLKWGGDGTITGDLIGLNEIEVVGNVRYATVGGTDRTDAHIRLAEGGWMGVTDGGRLELVGAHTRLDGNLFVEDGATLRLNLYHEDREQGGTDRQRAILQVDGRAELEDGARLTFKADDKAFEAKGATYVLLQAGELDAERDKLDIASNSLLLRLVDAEIDGNRLTVTVTGKGGDNVEELLKDTPGLSDSARKGAGSFTDLLFSHDSDLPEDDPLRQTFIHLMGDLDESASDEERAQHLAKRNRLLSQMAPDVSGGSQRAAITGQGLVNSVTSGRTSALRGMSSGEQPQQTGVWIQRLDSDATQDASAGLNGFDVSSSGIAFGVDSTRDNLTMGVAYSLLETDVTGLDNKASVDSYGFALYGGWSNGAWFADGAFNYTLSDNESTRTIHDSAVRGDYTSLLVGGHLNIGYSLQLLEGLPVLNGLTVQPQVGARYSRVDIDAYEETGASSARRAYDKQTFQVGELGFGASVAATIGLPYGSLQPNAKLMFFSDLIGDKVSSTSGYVLGNTPMVTYEGAEPETSTLEISLGVDYRIGNFTLGGSYDRVSKSDFSADTLLAKLRYDF